MIIKNKMPIVHLFLVGLFIVFSSASYAVAEVRVRVVTANIDFGLSKKKVKEDWKSYSKHADVVLMQEAKRFDLRKVIGDSDWIIRQNTSSSAKAGSAIAVRRSIAREVSPLWLVKGVDASRCRKVGSASGIQARYIARVNIKLKGGRKLKVASAHLPPKRCWGRVYDTMAQSIKKMIRNTPGHFIIGADWNKNLSNNPNGIASQTRMKIRAVGNRIDGFLVTKKTKAAKAKALKQTNAKGHRPIQVMLNL